MSRPETDPAAPVPRDHLANERTLLAWVRTAITVMGLGFVIDRLVVEGDAAPWQSALGIGLVVFGASLAAAGGYLHMRAYRELRSGTYKPVVGLHVVLVGVVVVGGLAIAYLLLTS